VAAATDATHMTVGTRVTIVPGLESRPPSTPA
jgi:hypothetical protein